MGLVMKNDQFKEVADNLAMRFAGYEGHFQDSSGQLVTIAGFLLGLEEL